MMYDEKALAKMLWRVMDDNGVHSGNDPIALIQDAMCQAYSEASDEADNPCKSHICTECAFGREHGEKFANTFIRVFKEIHNE